jgi:hypothetical protein
MLEKAIAALKANEATAIATFNKSDGGYRDSRLGANAIWVSSQVHRRFIRQCAIVLKKKAF